MVRYLPDHWFHQEPRSDRGGQPDYLQGLWTDSAGLYWPVIIITLVVFLIFSEYGSQDCRHQVCNNKAQVIDPTDSSREAIDKIILTVRSNHTTVEWRRAMFVAIVVAILISAWYFQTRMPHGFIFFAIAATIFFGLYFAAAWTNSHWWEMNDGKIETALKDLRHRLGP